MYNTQADVGAAIKASRVPRSELFITSKIPCSRRDSHKYPNPMTKVDAETYLAQDLKQMGLDYVDLMLVHWPCVTTAETAAVWTALEDMVAKNKTRAIGISNFQTADIEALYKTANIKPAVNQCSMVGAGCLCGSSLSPFCHLLSGVSVVPCMCQHLLLRVS